MRWQWESRPCWDTVGNVQSIQTQETPGWMDPFVKIPGKPNVDGKVVKMPGWLTKGLKKNWKEGLLRSVRNGWPPKSWNSFERPKIKMSLTFEAVPPELRQTKDQAAGMRWILTWKQTDEGCYKAKARAILNGYRDRANTTPVMTRQTRQLLLQVAAWKRWGVKKGDVSGAFLQGREYPNELYCVPCPEFMEAKGGNTRMSCTVFLAPNSWKPWDWDPKKWWKSRGDAMG